MNFNCISCGKKDLDKDTIGINKKLIDSKNDTFYCIDCLANYLETTVEPIFEKIEEYKEEGCKLFK